MIKGLHTHTITVRVELKSSNKRYNGFNRNHLKTVRNENETPGGIIIQLFQTYH